METLTASEGLIVVGWVGEGVLYARLQGELYSSLGMAFAVRFEQLVADAKQVRYFVDAASLKTYDLLARSAIVRATLAHRAKFSSILLLNWDDPSKQAAATLLTALGDLLEVTRDPVDFQGRLLRAAPFANHRLSSVKDGAPRPPAAPSPRTR